MRIGAQLDVDVDVHVDVRAQVGAARDLIRKSGRGIWLQVDGGINARTAETAAGAGADSLVIGSALFSAKDPAGFLRELKKKV